MNLRDMILPEFDHESANTRKLLERIPDDKLAWKPHEKSFTMAELAGHIAQIPVWGFYTVTEDAIDAAKFPPPEPPKSRDEILERFDANTARMREGLGKVTDEALMKDWSLMMDGEPRFSMPRNVVLRGFVFNHLIHHRGQLTVYLRENDVPLPAIYGGSADEPMK